MNTLRLLLLNLCAIILGLGALSAPIVRAAPSATCADPGTLWVTSDADSGANTLRAAITQANGNPGPDRICFQAGLNGHSIILQSALPTITSDDVTIDASPNWIGTWPGGYPGITLDGLQASCCFPALRVSGAHNFVVKGLEIFGGWFPGSSTGSLAPGIMLDSGTSGATIGSHDTGGRLFLRDLPGDAILIDSSNDNQVTGVWIGTSDDGNQREPNLGRGIVIHDGQRNHIGRGDGYIYNRIGSSTIGVEIWGTNAISNTVEGNTIGPTTSGGTITNTCGVHIYGGASMNGIGGVVYNSGTWLVFSNTVGNTIYGSGQDGVWLENSTTNKNGVMASQIDGSNRYGIHLDGDSSNVAGSNTVTHNGQTGIMLDNGASGDWIVGNYVGTDKWGNTGLNNGHHAIGLYNGAQNNTIQSNWAVASGWSGIVLVNSNTQKNWVVTNRIGVGPQGQALGNQFYGVAAVDSPFNVLTSNRIANNGTTQEAGVFLSGSTAVGNGMWVNSIHDNAGPGIFLTGGANDSLLAPIITDAVCPIVRGTRAPPFGIVQLFSDQAEEGGTYEARTTADASGNWQITTEWDGPHLTATASLTLTAPSAIATKAMPQMVLAPDFVRDQDGPRSPLLNPPYLDTSPFSAYVAAPACRQMFLPLINR